MYKPPRYNMELGGKQETRYIFISGPMAALGAAGLVGGGSLLGGLFGGSSEESGGQKKFMGLPIEDVYHRAMEALRFTGPPTTEPLPAFKDYPELRTLTGGDYDKLQESIYGFGAGRLEEDRGSAVDRFRAGMRKIGMADDPSAYKLQEETIGRPYTRGLTDLALGATSQRYGLQANELANLNIADTARTGAENTYGLQRYQSSMAPFYAKAGLISPMLPGPGAMTPTTTQPTYPWAKDIGSDLSTLGMMGMMKYGMV